MNKQTTKLYMVFTITFRMADGTDACSVLCRSDRTVAQLEDPAFWHKSGGKDTKGCNPTSTAVREFRTIDITIDMVGVDQDTGEKRTGELIDAYRALGWEVLNVMKRK